MQAIRADLREWLRRAARDVESGWVPHRFELSFGIVDRDRANATRERRRAGALPGGLRLRGAIDLVDATRSAARSVDRPQDRKVGQMTTWSSAAESAAAGPLRAACEHLLATRSTRAGFTTALPPATTRSASSAERRLRAARDGGDRDRRSRARSRFLPPLRRGTVRVVRLPPRVRPVREVRTARKKRDALADLERLRSLP